MSLNAYKEEELAECFERNAEGLLKNMAIHELALAVTFYGVRADNIADVRVNPANSCVQVGAMDTEARVSGVTARHAARRLSVHSPTFRS